MTKQKFLTVVYTINDEEAFKEERASVMEKFKESKDQPWAITALSVDHEINRVDFLTEALSNQDYQKADALLGHLDVGNLKDLDELAE